MSEGEIGIVLDAIKEVRADVKENSRDIIEIKTTVKGYNELTKTVDATTIIAKDADKKIEAHCGKHETNVSQLKWTLIAAAVTMVVDIVVVVVKK